MSGPDLSRRLIAVTLDAASFARASPQIEHERATAIYDLVEESDFALPQRPGPYRLAIALADRRLMLDVRGADDAPLIAHVLALSPFRTLVKDYFLICESYHDAIRTGAPSRIEAIDMGRRALHNEGAELLRRRLDGKIALDLDTARRLFTLICVLHWRG